MSKNTVRLFSQWLKFLQMKGASFWKGLQHYGFQLLFIGLLGLLLWHKNLHFELNLNATSNLAIALPEVPAMNQSLLPLDFLKKLTATPALPTKPVSPTAAEKNNLSNTYSNLLFKEENNISLAQKASHSHKKQKQQAYIRRFAKVAQAEMHKYGIPASIKLAQGLIESNAGESALSTKNNNHFGIKCFSRKCRKGHCSNFTDDSHKDFFRIYPTAWESYRAHSKMLNGKRYRHLQKLDTDYRAWAHGLKKAGYATDPKYAQKLIFLIESLRLDQYDQ